LDSRVTDGQITGLDHEVVWWILHQFHDNHCWFILGAQGISGRWPWSRTNMFCIVRSSGS